jgi:hypothetical protein
VQIINSASIQAARRVSRMTVGYAAVASRWEWRARQEQFPYRAGGYARPSDAARSWLREVTWSLGNIWWRW